jgi:PAS domain S-box-containing protein
MHSLDRPLSARFLSWLFSAAPHPDLARRGASFESARGKALHATYITDSDWKITHVSAGFTLMSGLAPKDAIGKTPAELIAPEGSAGPGSGHACTVHDRLRLGSLIKREGVLRRPDGTGLSVRVWDTPLFDEEGSLSSVFGEIERMDGRPEH